jgi:hypothetical protein
MANRVLPPYLIESNGTKRCSKCSTAFNADSKPSVSAAFKEHVIEVHRSANPREAIKGVKREMGKQV